MKKTKQTRRVVIFANGPISDYKSLSAELKPTDTIVCVDGGLRHADHLQLNPDVIIGDMDSISRHRLEQLASTTTQIEFPREKDETDLELALQWAGENAYDSVLLTGISGGRIDHTLANIHLLAQRHWRFDLCAWQPGQYMWLIKSGETLNLDDHVGKTLSLIPMSERVEGICTDGLKYPLNNEDLLFGSTRGVSNVIDSSQASISIKKGMTLAILTYNDIDFP